MVLTRRRLLFVPLGAALGACGSPPAAQAAAGQLVQMQLVERAGGEVLDEYRHRGSTYVAGRPGDRYAVRLSNRTGGRVLVVLSVDGVNAVSGETAATSQTGYVLSPWQTADIVGWRKTDAEAAAFYFTALPDSYAARTDRPQNVGVVGVAVFRERLPAAAGALRAGGAVFEHAAIDFIVGQRSGRDGAAAGGAPAAAAAPAAPPAPAAAGAAAESSARGDGVRPRAERQQLGTGHGEREYSPISRTAFERASAQPAEIVQVRYDSHANLVAAGIIGAPPPRRWGAPDPFPGYVPDPR